MNVHWTRTLAPADEPISQEQARIECRIDVDDENAKTDEDVRASRQEAEEYLGRGLFTQTWKLVQDAWTDEIWLPMGAPLQTVVVQYYDGAGTLSTLSATTYLVDTTSEPGRVQLKPTYTWPTVQSDRPGAVVVTYVVGWSDTDDIPPLIKSGILVMVRARYLRLTGEAWRDAWETARRCYDLAGRVYWRPACTA